MYKKFEIGPGCDPLIYNAWYDFLDYHEYLQYKDTGYLTGVNNYLQNFDAISVITNDPWLKQFLIFNSLNGYINFILKHGHN